MQLNELACKCIPNKSTCPVVTKVSLLTQRWKWEMEGGANGPYVQQRSLLKPLLFRIYLKQVHVSNMQI